MKTLFTLIILLGYLSGNCQISDISSRNILSKICPLSQESMNNEPHRSGSLDIKIKVTGPVLYDETYIRFIENATAGFDSQYDAYKLMGYSNVKPTLYSIADSGINVSVNSLPDSLYERKIPLMTIFRTAGDHKLTFPLLSDFPDNYNIIIKDHKTNERYDIKNDTAIYFNVGSADLFQESNRFTLYIFPDLELESYTNAFCSASNSGSVSIKVRNTNHWIYTLYNGPDIFKRDTVYGDNMIISGLYPGDYKVETGTEEAYQSFTFTIIHQYPFDAKFTVERLHLNEYKMENKTNGSVFNYWTVNGQAGSNDEDFVYEFKDTGLFEIELLSYNGYCYDSSTMLISIDSLFNHAPETIPDIFLSFDEFANEKLKFRAIKNSIHVENPSNLRVEVITTVYNVMGQTLFRNNSIIEDNSNGLIELPIASELLIVHLRYFDRIEVLKLL